LKNGAAKDGILNIILQRKPLQRQKPKTKPKG